MSFTFWELAFYIIPCLIEVFIQYLELKRSGMISSAIAFISFVLFVLGLICVIGAFGLEDQRYHVLFFSFARGFLVLATIGWVFSQVLWLKRRITVVDNHNPPSDQVTNP